MPALKHYFFRFCTSGYSILLVCILASCSGNRGKSEHQPAKDSMVAIAPVQNDDSSVINLSRKILSSLKKQDYQALIQFVHPEAGVRFSPYGFIDTVHDRLFTKDQLARQLNAGDSLRMYWGAYDGSGDSIHLTLPAYIKKFVYDVDFLNAETKSLDSIVGLGNSLNNLQQVYPQHRFTESHFSGFDPKYNGMDWRSLRLVFRKKGADFFLVGIVHDQWTT